MKETIHNVYIIIKMEHLAGKMRVRQITSPHNPISKANKA